MSIEWTGLSGNKPIDENWKSVEFPVEFLAGGWNVYLASSEKSGMVTATFTPIEEESENTARVLTYRVSELVDLNEWLRATGAEKYPLFRFIEPKKDKHF